VPDVVLQKLIILQCDISDLALEGRKAN